MMTPTRSVLIIFLLALTSGMAQADAKADTPAPGIAADCKSEGEASGMQGRDLQTYIEECISDFEDTTMSTNIKLSEQN
ncbi:MAG TPA: hypothetical protein ENJ84_15525 [Gammaproteobacteria bacterium]|nr:hypothetical protein [Gammaproteobacteria bacterium]